MYIESLFAGIDIATTGLNAERKRMDAISSNIANIHTTRTKDGGPYRRQIAVFRENLEYNKFYDFLKAERLRLTTTDDSHLLPKDYLVDKEGLTGVNGLILRDNSAPRMIYNPSHPDADSRGYVAMPNIDIVTEMTDLIASSRSYEANVTTLNAAKGMAKNAIKI